MLANSNKLHYNKNKGLFHRDQLSARIVTSHLEPKPFREYLF